MSTATIAVPTFAGDERPSLARLTKVELRKMTDTRAGFWLMLGVLAITVAVVVLSCVLGDDHSWRHVLANGVEPAGILLPVVGILLYTSEFTQRTSLATFTLAPRRGSVLLAKLGASVVLSVVVTVLCVALAGGGAAIAGGATTLSGWMVGQTLVYVGTAMITGVAFGAALRTTAPAIVAFFVLPIAFTFAAQLSFMKDAARWLDMSDSLSRLTEHALSGVEWGRAATTLAVWMVLPLALGAWRLVRDEIG